MKKTIWQTGLKNFQITRWFMTDAGSAVMGSTVIIRAKSINTLLKKPAFTRLKVVRIAEGVNKWYAYSDNKLRYVIVQI